MIRSVIRGIGSYLPDEVITNADLAKVVDTSDDWIRERTGITQRYRAAPGQMTSDLATEAARRAIDNAGFDPDTIDLIVLSTSTPDYTFPATATTVQANLGITGGAAFDVQAVCTGFVYALAIADNFIKAGTHSRVLVIGAETYSRILDWNDRNTCVLFGDGAGAVVLEAEQGDGTIADRGILATRLRSDGRHKSRLYVDGGPSSTQTVGHLRMEGNQVFKLAVGMVPQVLHEILDDNNVPMSDIDWFVPHQANKRIIDATEQKLGIGPEKVVLTVDLHANTSSASIPLALDVAVKDGRIKPGHLVLLEAMGGGFTWGAALVRW
ncbi:MAG: ketoacyl-ACP synthase III [Hyphomicrobiaceae bacterium]|nr:ketoacyl-ACP synthase III [Hyphomicrobiaceae bacterium]